MFGDHSQTTSRWWRAVQRELGAHFRKPRSPPLPTHGPATRHPHAAPDGCTRRMRCCVLGLLAMGLSCQGAGAQTLTMKSVRLEWRDACKTESGAAYFTMEVSRDGSVKYDGALWSNQRWSRRQRIASSKAHHLVATAVEAKPHEQTPNAETSFTSAGVDCTTLTTVDRSGHAVQKISLESDDGRRTEEEILKAIEVDPRKCSSRERLPKGCGGVVLSFAYYEQRACQRNHITNVYPNGLVHYYVDKILSSDRYAHISPANITSLQEHPVDAPLEQISGLDNSRYYYQSYAEALRQRFESLTGIAWVKLDETTQCGDPQYGPKATVTTVP